MRRPGSVRKAVALVGMMVVFSRIGFAQCKVAVVDMQAAVVNSNEGKAQTPKFDTRVKEWTAKLDVIRGEILKTLNQMNGQAARPPEDTVAVLNARIREKYSALVQMLSDAQKDGDTYRDSLLGSLKKVAAETAEAVASEQGITSVVDSSVPLTAPIPAGGGKDCDITTEVITRMNAKFGVDTPAK